MTLQETLRDILETASECLHKKNHGVWKQTQNVSDFNLLYVFFSLATRQKLHFEISQGVKVVKIIWVFICNFCRGGNFLRGVAHPIPHADNPSYSPRAKSPRRLTRSESSLSFTRIPDTKHKCEQSYIFLLLSIDYD